jgi:hypothetical protein
LPPLENGRTAAMKVFAPIPLSLCARSGPTASGPPPDDKFDTSRINGTQVADIATSSGDAAPRLAWKS